VNPIDLEVRVNFHQYFLFDSVDCPDWPLADATNDGVIAPLPTGIKINTGRQYGIVLVGLLFSDPGPAIEAPGYVAAQADFELPSGVVELWGFDPPRLVRHDFGAPTAVHARVAVTGRDTSQHGGTPEQHIIHVWPATEPATRWRTLALDRIGMALAVSAVRPPAPDLSRRDV
jgi:hypothetical protein